jgi:hypothetical protein
MSYENAEHPEAYARAVAARIEYNRAKGGENRAVALYGREAYEAMRVFTYAKADRGNTFFRSMVESFEKWGCPTPKCVAIIQRTMTEDADKASARKAAYAAEDAKSEYQGTVKVRQNWTATLVSTWETEGDFGLSYGHKLRDEAGNVFTLKATKPLARETATEAYTAHDTGRVIIPARTVATPIAKGETVTFAASVKAHKEYNGCKQTILTRAKVI